MRLLPAAWLGIALLAGCASKPAATDAGSTDASVPDAGVCTGVGNDPSGGEYDGLCQPNPPVGGQASFPETCNGVDDDCDGVTDDDLGEVSCGTGACATSGYSCTDSVGDAGFEIGTPTDCMALEPNGCDGPDE